MFSSTTIESSTRMPIISARAIRLMMLRLKPSAYMTRNVLTRLVGMASSTMTVWRQACRNSSMTPPTSSTDSSRSCWIASSEARVKTEVSLVMTTCEPLGSSFCSLRQRHADVVGHLQRVGVGLLDDLQTDGILRRCSRRAGSAVCSRAAPWPGRCSRIGPPRGGLAHDQIGQIVDRLERAQRADVQRRRRPDRSNRPARRRWRWSWPW